jgi:hypothetical protein
MTEEKTPSQRGSKWLFITPIEGVILTSDTNFEYQIDKVLLIQGKKLSRARKRFSLPQPISKAGKMFKGGLDGNFFSPDRVYAVSFFSGIPEKHKEKWVNLIENELHLLSASQLGWGSSSHPRMSTGDTISAYEYALVDTNQKKTTGLRNWHRTGKFMELELEARWLSYQKRVFFDNLLKIFRGQTKIHESWRNDLYRATLLIGQSQTFDNLIQSFMWNFAALDILIGGDKQNKYYEILQQRANAFFSWMVWWKTDKYEEKIKIIYEKRSQFIHRGISNEITIEDVEFTNELLRNLLSCITHHPKIFYSKEALIQFARKVEAEHTLGLKPKIRPKTFRYYSKK